MPSILNHSSSLGGDLGTLGDIKPLGRVQTDGQTELQGEDDAWCSQSSSRLAGLWLRVCESAGQSHAQLCLIKRGRLSKAQLCPHPRTFYQMPPSRSPVGHSGDPGEPCWIRSHCHPTAASQSPISLPGSPEVRGLCSDMDTLFCD